jgi:putative transposase
MSYTERRLPHWIPEQTPIFVTWRLAGTLPRAAQEHGWMESDPQLDHAASGPRWLAEPALAQVTAKTLHHGEAIRKWYRPHAWVVMPNHVHAVMTPEHAFPEIMRWLKWTTAWRSNQFLGRTGIPFWQDESYGHWIRDRDELEKAVRYVERIRWRQDW